jgi:hypothetical protein
VTPAASGALQAAGGGGAVAEGAGAGAGAEAETIGEGGGADLEHAAIARAASQTLRCITPDYPSARQGQILG